MDEAELYRAIESAARTLHRVDHYRPKDQQSNTLCVLQNCSSAIAAIAAIGDGMTRMISDVLLSHLLQPS